MRIIVGAVLLLSLALSVCALSLAGQAARSDKRGAQATVPSAEALHEHMVVHVGILDRLEAVEARLDALEARLPAEEPAVLAVPDVEHMPPLPILAQAVVPPEKVSK